MFELCTVYLYLISILLVTINFLVALRIIQKNMFATASMIQSCNSWWSILATISFHMIRNAKENLLQRARLRTEMDGAQFEYLL